MKYTVNELAKLSGISIRALRYYDQIGLLKPAFVGENNYRYYQEEQLLRLQQILFFKELGLDLKHVKDILNKTDFNKLKALRIHAQEVQQRIKQLKRLSSTVSKTIQYLERKQAMNENEMYYGFDSKRQKRYQKKILEMYGDMGKKLTAEAKKNTKDWKQEDMDKHMSVLSEINSQLVQAMHDGLEFDAEPVQHVIEQHYQWLTRFYHPTEEVYHGLAELYSTNPEFRTFYERFHAELPDFLANAMQTYAKNNL